MLKNLKVYWKFLGRNKVYTAVTVAGFGVSLMFVIVLGLYVRQELSVDGFHENKDRIYLATVNPGDTPTSSYANPIGPWMAENYPDVQDYVRMVSTDGFSISPGREEIATQAMLADSTFFNVFSFPLTEGDPGQVLARPGSMVVSREFANRMFGGDDPMGRSVIFRPPAVLSGQGVEFTVTGVMADFPTNTIFPQPDFIADYRLLPDIMGQPNVLTDYGNSSFVTFVVERPGGNLMSLREDMATRFKEFWWFFELGFATRVDFIPLEDVYFSGVNYYIFTFRSNSMTRVMLYLGISLLILVVALLNYVNMTVAQAGFRAREVALKKLHGASRGMIIAQLLSESLMMTLISFGVGLMLAFGFEGFFDDVLGTTLGLGTAFTPGVIAVIAVLIVVLALVSGILPAVVMSRFKALEIIKGGFSRRVKGVYSRVLAVFQYTVSIGLLICSAVIVSQSRYLSTRDVGLVRDGVMLIDNVEPDEQRQKAVAELIRNIPGVEAVSRVGRNPYNSWGGNRSFTYEGEQMSFETMIVDSAFFNLFGVTYEPTGIDPNAPFTMYLNRPGYNALRVAERDNRVDFVGENYGVAGILSDFNFRPLKESQGLLALEVRREQLHALVIAVRIAPGPGMIATAERVARTYSDFVGGTSFEWQWADDTLREFYQTERRTSRVMGAFTVLVMVIMFMGIFAMSIYILRQKEKEIAIRKVNGSTIGEILALLSRQSVVSVAVAFVVACPVAWWAMTRWLQSFPYRTQVAWLLIFVVAGGAVLLLSFVCVGWQSWRAATANPVESLKSE